MKIAIISLETFFIEIFSIVKNVIKRIIHHKLPTPWSIGNKGNVLLIPGFTESWQDLEEIGNYLNTLGYKIYIISKFNTTFLSIRACSRIIKKFILKNNLNNLVLVGHSKG